LLRPAQHGEGAQTADAVNNDGALPFGKYDREPKRGRKRQHGRTDWTEKPRRRTYMVIMLNIAFDAGLVAFVALGLVWAFA
jgi:hypothetical protein